MGRLSLNLTLLHFRSRSNPNRLRPRRQQQRSVSEMVDDERHVNKKIKLDDIALESLIDNDDGDDLPPIQLEVVSVSKKDVNYVDLEECKEEFKQLSDDQLQEKIKRVKTYLVTLDLPDNGARLKLSVKRMEAEFERRIRDKDAYVRENPPQSKAFNISGVAAGFYQDTPLSHGKNYSQIVSKLNAMLERTNNRGTGSCNQLKRALNGQLVPNRRQTSKYMPQCPTRLASNKTSYTPVNSERRGNVSEYLISQRSLPSRAGAPKKLDAVHVKKRQEGTVVLLDDEESEPDDDNFLLDNDMHLDDTQHHFGNFKCQVSKISYPSREDPTHVDIDFSDIKCLEPEQYLSSPIMNFYIRYLQQLGFPIRKSKSVFHCFNTFFYSKLKGAVSNKEEDSGSFEKFRRWWKGINIFHKAYILIPVHEYQHWSLIIICMPYRDRETGPLILHLDSLELHYSQPIFKNIKRFIREEWEYLIHDGARSNLPWENLPRRIEEKYVMVPQQKNAYDCGLFVLYFMERFIAEAPDRLSREDLHMFNRQWFRPAEASYLRTKIRKLLIKEFCSQAAISILSLYSCSS